MTFAILANNDGFHQTMLILRSRIAFGNPGWIQPFRKWKRTAELWVLRPQWEDRMWGGVYSGLACARAESASL